MIPAQRRRWDCLAAHSRVEIDGGLAEWNGRGNGRRRGNRLLEGIQFLSKRRDLLGKLFSLGLLSDELALNAVGRRPVAELPQALRLSVAPGLFRLIGLRPRSFVSTLRHIPIVFGRTTAQRSIVRQASHPVRHIGDMFARGSTTGTGRQCHPCKAQVGKSERGRRAIHFVQLFSDCGEVLRKRAIALSST